MHKKSLIKNIVITILIIVALFFLSNLVSKNKDDEGLKILVSILPQKEFVTSVLGQDVEVQELIHAGESPATYTMTVSDIALVENADIYFMHGHLPFEDANLDKIKELNPDIKIVDLSEGIDLRYFEDSHEEEDHEEEENADHHDHTGVDPHYWLSPKNVIKNIETIRDYMIVYDVTNADLYRSNAAKYISDLNELDQNITADLLPLKGETFLCYHPSWGYFTADYGLTQYAIENEGKDHTVDDIKNTVDIINDQNIIFIILQEQFSTEFITSLSDETGIKIISLDTLAPNYIENMENIVNTMVSEK